MFVKAAETSILLMRVTILFLFILVPNIGFSQKGITNFGLQFKPIVPVSYFNAGPVSLNDSIVDVEIKQKYGYSMGMVIRHNFTNLIAFETGINYVRRNYDMFATSKINTQNDILNFGFVSYEIPLQGLIYIQLSKHVYMNVSTGVGLNAYASHVTSQGENLVLSQLSFRGRLIGMSYLANLGFEYRTKEKGNFYLGASLVSPFSPITQTKIKYEFQKSTYSEFITFLNGNYLTIDLRYILPEKATD